MSIIVSASEAKARFGEMLKRAAEQNDEVIVKLYGEPKAVLLSYAEYETLLRLRKLEQKRKVLAALDELRQAIRQENPGLSAEAAYRLAGFSEEAIQDTLRSDAELNAAEARNAAPQP